MKIYVVGSSKNKFLPLDNIREKYIIDEKHKGDNIDFLNPWYCELTGLYYLWKHVNDDIIGLEHYRRYFFNKIENRILSEEDVNKILQNNDIICKKYRFFGSNKPITWLNRGRFKYTLRQFKEMIPDKKLAEFWWNCLYNRKEFCQCNMFIGKKEIIDKYCSYLFEEILFNFNYTDFKNISRIIGYLAEYFFGFWLEYNGYKIKYEFVAEIDKNKGKIIKIN